MILSKLKLKNFRSYQQETTINIEDNLTALIGLNGAGKSTILEALEIFFNNSSIKIDRDDLCKSSSETETVVEITCVFKDLPAILVIDTSSPTSLSNEFLLNENRELEIVKQYDCSKTTVKPTIYAKAQHPYIELITPLHSLKISQLKTELTKLQIDPSNIDLRSNVSIRNAIWNHLEAANNLRTQLISLEKEGGKIIYKELEKVLPMYVLFQSDRSSRDDDSEVQDPMKVAIKEAIKEVEDELEIIKGKIQQTVKETADRTLIKLQEIDPHLANELHPNFRAEPKWDSIFKFSLTDDNDIPINKRGSGARRLILISYFRAEAEKRLKSSNSKSIIYAIEEPETSQHPENQKKLVKALNELSNSDNCQLLLTTHVPRLAGTLNTSCLRFITRLDDAIVIKQAETLDGEDDILKEIVDTLGIIPDRSVQVILMVEGPNDIEFFENITPMMLQLDNTLPDLVNDNRIALIPLGGSTLKQWAEKYYTKNFSVSEVHIYDSDGTTPAHYQTTVEQINNRSSDDCAFSTHKRETENYIHVDAIFRALGITIAQDPEANVPYLVAEQRHNQNSHSGNHTPWDQLVNNKKKQKANNSKKELNTIAVSAMTLSELQLIDSQGELLSWFNAIKNRLQS